MRARRAGFVGADMGGVVRQNRLIGLGQHRQGDGVGGRSAKDEPHFGVRIQPLANLIGGACGDVVGAVGAGETFVGADQAFDGAGHHAGGVVGSEIVAHQRVVAFKSAASSSTVRTRTTGITSSSPYGTAT